MTEDEKVGCHHWFNEHESEQTQGDSEGQGSLVAAVPCGTELDTTEQVNHNSVLQWASDKAQGLVEVEPSTILHLVGSS